MCVCVHAERMLVARKRVCVHIYMVMCRSLSIHTAAAENEVKKSDEAEGILKYNV